MADEKVQEDEAQKIAHAIIEMCGGLEYIETFEFPRARNQETEGDDAPSVFNVCVCVYCHAPVWKSTEHADEDGWKIANFHSHALDACGSCKDLSNLISGPASQLAYRQAISTTMMLGSMLLQREREDDA